MRLEEEAVPVGAAAVYSELCLDGSIGAAYHYSVGRDASHLHIRRAAHSIMSGLKDKRNKSNYYKLKTIRRHLHQYKRATRGPGPDILSKNSSPP